MYPRSPSVSCCASYLMPDSPTRLPRLVSKVLPLATASMASRILTYPVQRHRWAPRCGAIDRRSSVVALLVDLRLGAHHDPRDAEAALQTAARGERAGVAVALGVVDSLERRDLATGDLVERLGAADDRLAVDEHRAAAALPRRRTPVLRRRDVELLAQGGEEVGVVAAHRHRCTVERELDAGALDRRHALHSVKHRAVSRREWHRAAT